MLHTHSTNPTPRLSGKIVALDVETDGLDPYHGHRMFCWAYFTEKGEYGFMSKNQRNLKWLKQLVEDSDKTLVFQNAKFDLKMMWFEGIDIYKAMPRVHDVMIMSKVLDSVAFTHNLRELSRRYLHKDAFAKDAVDDWVKLNTRSFKRQYARKPTFKDAPHNLVKKRNLWDAETTFYLLNALYPKVKDVCPELYETERQLVFVCVDMENTGVLIDITKAKQLRKEAQRNVDRIQKELDRLVCPLIIERKKRGKYITEVVDTFNPGSSELQLPAAFKKLGIKLFYKTKPKKKKKGRGKTKGGRWCFDEYAMVRYVSKPLALAIHQSGTENWSADRFYREVHSIARKHNLKKRELLPPLILKHREQSKLITTYYNHLINDCVDIKVEPNGREVGVIHCHFNQSEAMTGRFSCSEPNLQNMPRLLGPRECFITRRGKRNWHVDYAQVEMRFYIHFSKDKKMKDRISSDLHRWTASEMYKKHRDDITKEERERAGSVNFMVIYGAGAEKAAETLSRRGAPTTVPEAEKFIGYYHSIYPSVRKTSRRLGNRLKKKGYITNPFGRRFYIPKKLAYKALNYMCQGTSADQIKKAMVDIWLWLRVNGFRTRMLITVHDELIFEIPHSEERLVIPHMIEVMEDHYNFEVPITVGIEVAKQRWSEKVDSQKLGLHWLDNILQ